VHPRLETPTVCCLLKGVFVAAFPVNDIALPGGLIRDREQRGRRLGAARCWRYHRADHDVIFRIRLRRPAALRPATSGGTELLAAPKPDLDAGAPLRRHAECCVVSKEVRVGVAVVPAVVEDLRVALDKLTNVDVVLRFEPPALGSSPACCSTRKQRHAKRDQGDAR